MHEREPRRGVGVGGGEGWWTFAYTVICALVSKKRKKKKKKSSDVSGHLLKGILAALGHDDPR